MSSLILRGARVEDYKGYCSSGGQFTVEARIRCAWTDPVCDAMGWVREPSGFGNGGLKGKLNGINLILEPNKKELKDHRIDVAISSVGSFKHRAKTEDEEVTTRELEFVVTSVAEDADVCFANYIRNCGPSEDKGQCKINFSAEKQEELIEDDPKQMKIDGAVTAPKPRGRAATKEN